MSGPDDADRTLLVVDDDVDLLEMMATVLESVGHKVVTAENGLEALRIVDQFPPALIFLDMKMPVMDGWEFARRFREKHGRQIPLIVVTAAQDARTWAAEVGADGYLAKPFDIDSLLKCVEAYCPAP